MRLTSLMRMHMHTDAFSPEKGMGHRSLMHLQAELEGKPLILLSGPKHCANWPCIRPLPQSC